jgi:hypothetical protein
MAEKEEESALVNEGAAKPAGNEGDGSDFKPGAFIETEEPEKPDPNKPKGETETGEEEEEETETGEDSIWDENDLKLDLEEEEETEEEELDENGQKKAPETDPDKIKAAAEEKAKKEKEKAGQKSDLNLDEFKELGIEAKDKDELKAKIKATLDENEQLKAGTVKNEKLDFYRKVLNLDDKELLKKELAAQGFEGQELEDAIATYEGNGTLAIEAKKIRNSLNNAITRETIAEKERIKQSESARRQQKAEAQKLLKDHLGKTDTMLGFKMGKNPQEIEKRKEDHFRYIDSGKFVQEIFDSPEALSDAAWFHRNKKTIMKALMNKGSQTAKAEFLNNIGNPTKVNSDSHQPPGDTGDKEFNPKKFTTSE